MPKQHGRWFPEHSKNGLVRCYMVSKRAGQPAIVYARSPNARWEEVQVWAKQQATKWVEEVGGAQTLCPGSDDAFAKYGIALDDGVLLANGEEDMLVAAMEDGMLPYV